MELNLFAVFLTLGMIPVLSMLLIASIVNDTNK